MLSSGVLPKKRNVKSKKRHFRFSELAFGHVGLAQLCGLLACILELDTTILRHEAQN